MSFRRNCILNLLKRADITGILNKLAAFLFNHNLRTNNMNKSKKI